MARDAVQQVAATDPGDVDVDPASQLFFEFAARALMASLGTYSHASVSMLALARRLGTAVYWPRVFSVP